LSCGHFPLTGEKEITRDYQDLI